MIKLDTTQWGWVHLIIGILVFLAGLGIFSGNVLARTVGVLVAIGSAVSAASSTCPSSRCGARS